MTFRSALKTIAKVSLGIFSLLGLCVVLWLAWALYINLFDEPLTPEAEAMLSYRAKALPDAENGYVMMAGFTSPADSDWKKVGAERIARYNERVRASRMGVGENETKVQAEEEAQKLTFSECGGCEEMVRYFTGDNKSALLVSLQLLLQQQEKIDKALADNAELVRRYETLQSALAFSETALPSIGVSIGGLDKKESSVFPIQQLLLSKVTLTALSGDRESLLDFLERDLSFWRLVTKSDSTLITAIFARAFLMQELRLLRVLLAQVDFSTSELERLRRLLKQLSAEERSLLRALEYEWNARAHMFLRMGKQYSIPDEFRSRVFLKKWLFQPQATVNLFAERMRPWRELASLSSPKFTSRYAVLEAPQEKKEVIEIPDTFQNIFNYAGHLLVVIAEYNYEKHIARHHDLAAAMQLTRAQVELRIAGIDAGKNPEAVPEFLKHAGEEIMNPYTRKPFDWNADCRRLSFTPHGEGLRTFSEVTLADVPEENAIVCAASEPV